MIAFSETRCVSSGRFDDSAVGESRFPLMERREALKMMLACAGAVTISGMPKLGVQDDKPFVKPGLFSLGARTKQPDVAWMSSWDAALATLAGNVQSVPHFDRPVLFEGSVYRGTWQECGPHESFAYAELSEFVKPMEDKPSSLEIAKNTHRVFFKLQREDGQMPASVQQDKVDWGQCQMVVPIASTAWEVAQISKDEAFLSEAYSASSRWDAWLRRYRDTRRTGLVEAFCTWDTGQDNSPRWQGVSNACPDADARKCPAGQSVPRLCPDLSATVFGARIAMSQMATVLGKKTEAQKWMDDAERIRALIVEKLWSEEDASFFDVGPNGNFVRVRSVANVRVLGEHILRLSESHERKIFDALWDRQLNNPSAYWAKYPFPSIALNDPKFVRPIPPNSWGGASQALTALRTLRWMEYYGRGRELRVLMGRWCDAIVRAGGFRQQMDPNNGLFTQPDPGGYSPCALVFLHFARRLGHGPPPTMSGA